MKQLLFQEKEQEGIEPSMSPPGEVSLPDNVEDIFAKLSPEDVQAIIEEMAQEVLQTLHVSYFLLLFS